MDQAPSTPSQVGPYRILDVLGEGGMGVVYAAEQRSPFFRRVALKVIKIGMDTKEVLARFEAERQALALLDHPNIAKVIDAGTTTEGRPYFAMELVRGLSLTRYCDEARLPISERVELVIQACAALQHAHERGIIHRDIKPTNLLATEVDGKPMVKVIDFGLAKAINQRLTERTLFTEEGRIIGTPEYMSPEQAETSSQDVDARSDVFSLGVVLYELIAGALPFDFHAARAKGYFELQRCIREDDPPTPRQRLSTMQAKIAQVLALRRCRMQELAASLKSGLDAVTMRAIAKNRRDRYSSCADLAADLRRFLAHEPVRAKALGGIHTVGLRLRRLRRRHPELLALATGCLLTALYFVALRGESIAPWENHPVRASLFVSPDTALAARQSDDEARPESAGEGVVLRAIEGSDWSFIVTANAPSLIAFAAAAKDQGGVMRYAPIRLGVGGRRTGGAIRAVQVLDGETKIEAVPVGLLSNDLGEVTIKAVFCLSTDEVEQRKMSQWVLALESARQLIEANNGEWLTAERWRGCFESRR